jgi:malate synthase
VSVSAVDREIAELAAPQLVVPIDNARFAVNAVNARWGSLYDALYGSDMIPDEGATARGEGYNPLRGQAVFDFCNRWMDETLPLRAGSHAGVVAYELRPRGPGRELVLRLADGRETAFADAEFVGWRDDGQSVILLRHHGLHLELHIDRDHPVGRAHPAGLSDLVLEAAVTVIQDGEDSVSAVDVADKLTVYGNWLALIRGTLEVAVDKGGRRFTRRMNPPRRYRAPGGDAFELPGRALMLLRNVGLHMKTDLVLDADGNEMPEGLVDALATVLIALHDRGGNSREGSIYIVKPKLHGPEEVRFSCDVFAAIERGLGLEPNRIKIGVMDEERRTTLNLAACIHAARERVIFINTGFLDRTGDEIHTSMQAGPVLPKGEMKQAAWMQAYEEGNVEAGLACGLDRVGQIGKGMWAAPDAMRAMYEQKIAHPRAGASCAWVPSPTAAVLHALHYHQVDVAAIQQRLRGESRDRIESLLRIPLLAPSRELDEQTIRSELDNNAQGMLGYVVRWIDQGIGCSKVPDIHDTGLMEDRATLRISSQHIANWLEQGLCDAQQVIETFRRMAEVVDRQNAGDPDYRPMAPDFDGPAFRCAMELVFKGRESPNGYTEEILRRWRRLARRQLSADG